MSNEITKTLLEAYQPSSLVHDYFTSLCKKREFSTETVEVDVERDDEDVAVVVSSLESGGRMNESTLYTNKEFLPPVYKEQMTIPAGKLIKRVAGEIPFSGVEFQARASALAMKGLPKLEKKLRRAVELQASQVLQTGALSLIDNAGSTVFSMNFSPKSSHFPTVGTTWATASTDALGDLASLAQLIYRDGKATPNRLTFGKTAWIHFLNNTGVKAMFAKDGFDRANLGVISNSNGAIFQGQITVNSWRFDLYTYEGFYKHPQTGVLTPFIGDDKVVMTSDQSKIVAAFGAVPQFPADSGTSALQYMPGMISGPSYSFTPTAWTSQDRQFMTLQIAARPLVIPVGIDTFGCLDVVP